MANIYIEVNLMILSKFHVTVVEAGYKHGDYAGLAKELGVSKPTLSAMMNKAGYQPTLETAIKAARFFGKTVEEIWSLEEE